MKRWASILLLLGASGCGQSQDMKVSTESLKTFDVAEEPPPPNDLPGIVARPEVPRPAQAAPEIAYTYSFGYRVDAPDVPQLQRRHVAMCDRLGPARCRIVSMTRDSGDGQFVQAALSLLVDARIARAFGDRLDAAVAGAGGAVSARGIQAEDLSKQIVDNEARVRGKQALAERLLALLQNRQGKVGELVEAERAYASAQEELDSARSWLAEMRGRVAMSKLEISYASESPQGSGWWQPIRSSIAEAGQVFGSSIAALITLLLALLPWVLAAAGLIWLLRRLRWFRQLRIPRWRRARPAPQAASSLPDER
jgi:hypothetical protein